MTLRHVLTFVFVLVAAVSCRPEAQRTDQLDLQGAQARDNMPPEAVVQLDSGSLAFREGDYEAALEHYDRATGRAPGFGAGWFGVYMAYDAMGRKEEADSAIARARSLNPGASLIRDTLEEAP